MSWIVENLLRSAIEIKTQPDIESDDFNNLLVIEKKISEMKKEGLLSNKDLELLEHVKDGKPLDEAGDKISKSRITLARKFYVICNRIAYALGDEFTDDGYLAALQKRKHLTDNEVEKGAAYMKGRYKYKIMRKIIK